MDILKWLFLSTLKDWIISEEVKTTFFKGFLHPCSLLKFTKTCVQLGETNALKGKLEHFISAVLFFDKRTVL